MTDLDHLMALDPLQLSAQDIDEIVNFHRQQRAHYESGGKPKRPSGAKAGLDSVVRALKPKVELPRPNVAILDQVIEPLHTPEFDPPPPAEKPFDLPRRRL